MSEQETQHGPARAALEDWLAANQRGGYLYRHDGEQIARLLADRLDALEARFALYEYRLDRVIPAMVLVKPDGETVLAEPALPSLASEATIAPVLIETVEPIETPADGGFEVSYTTVTPADEPPVPSKKAKGGA